MTAPALDMEQLTRLKYLVGYQLWPHWEALPFAQEALAQAVSENEDLRLVAAYVLEQICEDAQRQLATTSTAEVKRVKIGDIDIEMRARETGDLQAQVEVACQRAAALRQQVKSAGIGNPAPILEGWGVA